MKLSWSHNVFFQINGCIGKNKYLDKFMYFCAHWLIYFLGFGVLLWAEMVFDAVILKMFIKLLLTVLSFGLATSWAIALIVPHHRPIAEFPRIKSLLRTRQTWKSFPSDHSQISMLFALMIFFMGASTVLVVFGFLIATLVAVGRVYVGAHYPRDVIGGWILALVYSSSSFWLVIHVTQPLYDFFVNYL